MNPATPSVHIQSENRASAPAAGRQFNVGQILSARVVGSDAGGGVVLDIGGQRIAAHALMPLTAGQELRLRVQGTGPETVLRIMDAGRGAGAKGGGDHLLKLVPEQPGAAAPRPGGAAPAAAGARAAAAATASGPPVLLQVVGRSALPHGQVFPARVISASDAGRLLLDVGGQSVAARARGSGGSAANALGAGQGIRVQVQRDAGGTSLRVLAAQATPARASPADGAMTRDVMRAALPRQQPLARSFTDLLRVLEDPEIRARPELAALRRHVDGLLRSLPARAQVSDPARLASMVRNSGLFYEASNAVSRQQQGPLARARNPGATDIKGQLQTIVQAVTTARDAARGAPPALLDSTQEALSSALARIETQQAASVRAGAEAPVWHLDLPVAGRDGMDDLRLRIAREGRGSGDEAVSVWTAELLVQPSGGAALHARLSLAPDGVVTVLTTEDAALHRQLEERAPALQALFVRAGLDAAGIHCRCAPVPELSPALPETGLVSERA